MQGAGCRVQATAEQQWSSGRGCQTKEDDETTMFFCRVVFSYMMLFQGTMLGIIFFKAQPC